MINLSHSVSGEHLGRLLGDDAEEAARAIIELAEDIDLAELKDHLEDAARYEPMRRIERARALAEAILSALPAGRPPAAP